MPEGSVGKAATISIWEGIIKAGSFSRMACRRPAVSGSEGSCMALGEEEGGSLLGAKRVTTSGMIKATRCCIVPIARCVSTTALLTPGRPERMASISLSSTR